MAVKPKGRPKGSKNKVQSTAQKKTASNMSPPVDREYYCVSCGKAYPSLKGNFRRSNAAYFQGNEGYIPVCSKCIDHYETELTQLYGDNDIAIEILCSTFGWYVNESILESSRRVNDQQSRIGSIISKGQLSPNTGKNYEHRRQELQSRSLFQNESSNNDSNGKKESESFAGWTRADKKNRDYVIHTIGYDCFNDISYSSDNKKFLYNTLADYLSDDVLEDQHKLQSVIAMVKTILQRENTDKLINAEMRKPNLSYDLIDKLGKIKDTYSKIINSTANENGIAAKTSGKNSKGSNTLTNIAKEMIENNFDDAKVNIVDVKMSKAYMAIAEKNSQALIAELNYQSDDYARLLGEQRAFVEGLQDRVTLLEEENRKLKINNKLKNGGDG